MELTVFVILFMWTLKMSSAIRCYSCEAEHVKSYNDRGDLISPCDSFDGSRGSITDCPESTMCVKRVTMQDIGPGLIRCYSCEAEHVKSFNDRGDLISPCDSFDGSRGSITDCPESTMCVKRVTMQDIGPGLSTRSVRRGCAAQTTKGMQEKVDGRWHALNKIYEVYEEGCIDDPSNEHKLTKTVLCHCRGDLCNAGVSVAPTSLLIALGVMFLRL